MILKDLETVGDKQMKKELDDNSPTLDNEQQANSVGQSTSSTLQQLRKIHEFS
jgi:hypothetical protein